MTQLNNNPEDPQNGEQPTTHGSVSSDSEHPHAPAQETTGTYEQPHDQANSQYPTAGQTAPNQGSYNQSQNYYNPNTGQNNPYAAPNNSGNYGANNYAATSYGSNNYGTNPYGGNGYGAVQQKPQTSVLGLIALGVAVFGFILGCIPIIQFLGWILLAAGFICGIIALFQKGKSKWPGIAAIVVSVLGSIISLIVAIVFVFGALADATDTDGSMSDTTTSASASASDDSQLTGSGTGKIGDTYTWDDGVSVTVSQPKSFKPTEAAAGNYDKSLKDFEKYTVTIKNDSDEPVDPTLFNMTGNSGGKEAERMFDTGISSLPTTKIQPGKSLTFDVGFAMADHKDASFDVSLDYDREEATFIQG